MADEPRARAEVNVRAVLIGASAIAAAVLISLLVAHGLLSSFGRVPPEVAGKPFTQSAGAPLEVTPQEDLQRFRAQEREKLERYRLVDPQAGIVQIPIERAMTLLAAEHGESATSQEAR